MVRIAVPTTLWSSADKNMPDIKPNNTNMIWRCVITPVFADSAAAALRSARATWASILYSKLDWLNAKSCVSAPIAL